MLPGLDAVFDLPPPGEAGLTFAFWSRGRADETLLGHPEVRMFTPAEIVDVT